MATIDDLLAYKQQMLQRKQAVTDALAAALGSSNNRQARLSYQAIATKRSKDLDDLLNETQRRISVLQKPAPGSAAAAAKPLTADQQLKQQNSAAAQENQGKLAKSQGDQLKALNQQTAPVVGLGGPGIVDALKTNPGVANYAPGQPPSSTVPSAVPGEAPTTLYSTPGTVTLQVPKTKDEQTDKDAVAAEKDRLLQRKGLDKDVQGMFVSPTGKVPTSDNIFGSGGLTFGPDPKDPTKQVVTGNHTGMMFQGTPEAYYEALKTYNATQPPPPSDKDKFNSVTIPADQYEAALGKYNAIVGPENAIPSAVQKEIGAHQILNQPAPNADIAAPNMDLGGPGSSGLRLNGVPAVPSIGPDRVPLASQGGPMDLRKITAGQPVGELNSPGYQEPLADANADTSAQAAQAAADQESQPVWDARQQPAPEDFFRRSQNSSIARELGFKVRPDQAGDILGQSSNPLIAGTGVIKATGGQPISLEDIKQKDYPTYDRLLGAAAANTAPGETDPLASPAVEGAGRVALGLVDPRADFNLAKWAVEKYGPAAMNMLPQLPSDEYPELQPSPGTP